MIALRMVLWNTNILVHVEGDDILERDLAILVSLDKSLVHTKRSSSSGQTQNKHLARSRVERIDPLDDILGSPLSDIS